MVDRRAGPSRRSYSSGEAAAHLVADNDSDIEQLSSETETESWGRYRFRVELYWKKQRNS